MGAPNNGELGVGSIANSALSKLACNCWLTDAGKLDHKEQPALIPLNDRVELMTRNVMATAIHHDLWSLHIRDTARAATATYREELQDLWSINSLAHRYAFYVRAAAAFVQSPKANSIPRLLRETRSQMDLEAQARSEKLLDEALPLSKKVESLRNQIYAHQSASRTVAEAYAQEQPTLDAHAKLVCLAMDLMNEIRLAIGLTPAEVSRNHIDEFFWVMEAIDERAESDE